MNFGALFGSGFGQHDAHIAAPFTVAVSPSRLSLQIQFTPADNMGDAYFGVYRNSQLIRTVYVAEGEASPVLSVQMSGARQSICVLRHGGMADYDMSNIARALESASSTQTTLSWEWESEIVGCIDSAGTENPDLSAWDINGIYPRALESSVADTRGTLTVAVVTDGDTTVTLSRNGETVAEGVTTAPDTCTLAEVDDSGISGTVAVGAAPTDASGSKLIFRWPASMQILRGAADPPTVTVATIPFAGVVKASWTEPTALAGGTYYYAIRPVSDTGDTGTLSAAVDVTIPAPPVSPADLAYDSGDAAETVLSFTPSTTAGATYRLYAQAIGADYMDMVTPVATAIAGSETITLPAVTGYPGKYYALLRAVSGGVEDAGGDVVYLEYDAAGDYVAPRPNAASIRDWAVTAGTTLTVTAAYDTTGEEGTATQAQLFIRDPDGAFDFNSPADSAALSAGFSKTIKTASLSASLANGWHYIAVKAATAAGVQSETESTEILVYASDANETPPEFEISVSRG